MVPLMRPSNSVEDLILTVELTAFLLDWRKQRSKPGWTHRAAYRLYALNLFLAICFTVSGTLLHMVDPLPQEPTMLWHAFVLSCVATPILQPIILTCALHPRMSRCSWICCCVWLVSSTALHALLLSSGVDLAAWGLELPAVQLGEVLLDGRSIGGEPYGIGFDLLTSIPTTRGDGLFVHATMFTVAAAACFLISAAAACRGDAEAEAVGVPPWAARQLALALGIMVLGQVTMIPLLCVAGVTITLDIWHISIFVVMALAYSALRSLLCEPSASKRL